MADVPDFFERREIVQEVIDLIIKNGYVYCEQLKALNEKFTINQTKACQK